MLADAILLLHGQPGSARDWDPVVGALDGRVRVIAYDRPGWDGRTAPADFAGNAAAALAALDRAGAGRATVVGHSFGAAVAAWLAATEPQRVVSVVLAAPAANVASLVPVDYLLALPVLGEALSVAALSTGGITLASRPLRHRVAEAFTLDSRYLRMVGRTLLTPHAWRTFAFEQRTLVRELPELERRLPQIAAPVTIAIGTADRIVPPPSARRLAGQIPGARLIEFPRAHHLLPQQHARELAELALAAGGT